ncbi:hypothetical protein F4556_005182 [Kitasatospora gansuensis]|uniref:Tail assembly chaperone n=1 Tax=Kitasatospora gansuensis TaxID=258050 RepID=A0A7W7WJA2_9ACTN|nr:phage tail assembly protein [Kitasatospora gansuensis]MBB4949647.1 hypothetical protein [Kitasatospora gansuensis]
MGVSLNSLMTEAKTRYTDVELELADGTTARLRNIMMLPDEERRAAQDLVASVDASSDEQEQLAAVIELLVAVAEESDAVRAEVNGWPAVAQLMLVEHYLEATQLGEASRSSN